MIRAAVGKALGATRNIAGTARSTGGRAAAGVAGGLHVGGNYLSTFGVRHGGSSGRAVGAMGRGVLAASRHPKTTMGAAAGGIGYMGYRSRRGSQNSPLQSFD